VSGNETILYNRKTLRIYTPEQRQVLQSAIEEEDRSNVALLFLAGMSKFHEAFIVSSLSDQDAKLGRVYPLQLTIAAFLDTGILFTIVFGALIFVHELGHFLFAKQSGVRVERFSLGFGPPLWRQQWKGTEYRISAIPLGGYVKMYNENPEEEVSDPKGSFLHQSVWKRIPIVAAGPFFNFFFAIALIAFIHTVGIPVENSVQIGPFVEDSAAALAGLQMGDIVVAVNGQPIERIDELKSKIMTSDGHTLTFRVNRGGQVLSLSITPHLDPASRELRIGAKLLPGEIVVERRDPLTALGQGFTWTWRIIKLYVMGFGKMLSGAIPVSESLAGPLDISREMGRQANYGWRNVVFFTAGISIILGLLNLFPIPVLDGGYLLFFAIEIVNGKPLSIRKREIAQQVGLLILVGLMLFAFYNDITNP
jgi:regulator of sigma E protease